MAIVSKLATLRMFSPCHSGKRTHAIDTITPHCVVGQMSADSLGHLFKDKTRQASCNYAIGFDGTIICIVPEEYRSWCTSSNSNDQRAITIECASDATHPYAFNEKVWESLIKLSADIVQRYNMKSLRWMGTSEYIGRPSVQNVSCHRWFDNKSCPGDWFFNRISQYCSEVNGLVEVNEMTDAQFGEFMSRWLEKQGKKDVSNWAKEDVEWAKDRQIMIGDGKGDLHPQSFVTRQEMACFLKRMEDTSSCCYKK